MRFYSSLYTGMSCAHHHKWLLTTYLPPGANGAAGREGGRGREGGFGGGGGFLCSIGALSAGGGGIDAGREGGGGDLGSGG
mmetsp:Transcript_4752/g.12668  ORF Transcript_4752/g.12668 Transcript_4752/m.12668 type:complete len:81 (-) Transcript_4752:1570-1812(-)